MKSFLGIALAAGVFVATPSFGSTYWASPTGGALSCAAASGTSDPREYRNLGQGLSCLVAGDTLILKAGVYNNLLQNRIPSGSSDASRVTIKSEIQHGAIIRPTGRSYPIIHISNDQFITIDGLTIDGSGGSLRNIVKVDGTSHDIEIINNAISKATGSLAVTRSTATRINFRGNILRGTSDTNDTTSGIQRHGFYWAARDSIIEYNDVYNIGGYGIQIFETTGLGGDNLIVRYNNFSHINSNKAGLVNSVGKNIQVYSNLFVNNVGAGAIERKCHPENVYYNNTIYGNSRAGLILDDYERHCPVIGANNLVIGNSGGQILNSGGGAVLINNITTGTAETHFVDAAQGDFSLVSTSPAIGAGTTSISDLIHVRLPDGSNPNIGILD